MQILSKTVKFHGTEKSDTILAVKCIGVVFVIENRGPATVEVAHVGPLHPDQFVVVGDVDEVAIHPPGQFAVIDVHAHLKG